MKSVAYMAADLAKATLALAKPFALAAPVAQAARLTKGITEKSANVGGVKINYKLGGGKTALAQSLAGTQFADHNL